MEVGADSKVSIVQLAKHIFIERLVEAHVGNQSSLLRLLVELLLVDLVDPVEVLLVTLNFPCGPRLKLLKHTDLLVAAQTRALALLRA